MKQLLLSFSIILLSFQLQAQVIAYPGGHYQVTDYTADEYLNCIDLKKSDYLVIRHQLNVNVTYHFNEDDAINNQNPLPRFYGPITESHNLYARVTSDLTTEYAISEIEISHRYCNNSSPGGPSCPPPPTGLGCGGIEICDIDDDGLETIYLNRIALNGLSLGITETNGYGAGPFFCSMTEIEFSNNFYLTEDDALNEINAINHSYTIAEDFTFYSKQKNTTTNESLIIEYFICFIDCPDDDTDGDGINDEKELSYDSDLDGTVNAFDNDDDEDGLLTILEDYNNNGDPTDDDTDSSGVADYLEANVTLSSTTNEASVFKMYPNPVKDSFLNIEFASSATNYILKIYDVNGKLVLQKAQLNNSENTLNVSALKSGFYFVTVQSDYKKETKKLIIK